MRTSLQRSPSSSPRRIAVPSLTKVIARASCHQDRSSSLASRSSSPYALQSRAISASLRTCMSGGSQRGRSTSSTGFARISRWRTACFKTSRISVRVFPTVFAERPAFQLRGDVAVEQLRMLLEVAQVVGAKERDEVEAHGDRVVLDGRRLQVPARQVLGEPALGEDGEGELLRLAVAVALDVDETPAQLGLGALAVSLGLTAERLEHTPPGSISVADPPNDATCALVASHAAPFAAAAAISGAHRLIPSSFRAGCPVLVGAPGRCADRRARPRSPQVHSGDTVRGRGGGWPESPPSPKRRAPRAVRRLRPASPMGRPS